MDRQFEINRAYERFGIPAEQTTDYTNAEEFSLNFKKCSVLKEINVSYSVNSEPTRGPQFGNE